MRPASGASRLLARQIHRAAVRRHLRRCARWAAATVCFCAPGIVDRQAAAGGEPEAPVGGAVPAAADRIAGSALRAAQPVFHAVIDGLERLALACGESRSWLLEIRQMPRVVLSHSDSPSSITSATLSLSRPSGRREVQEAAVAQGVQPAAESADPQGAVRGPDTASGSGRWKGRRRWCTAGRSPWMRHSPLP